MLQGWTGAFPRKEGGIKVLADLAPYSQRVGSLLRTPLSGKSARKIWQKVSSANSLQWKIHSIAFGPMNTAVLLFDKLGLYQEIKECVNSHFRKLRYVSLS